MTDQHTSNVTRFRRKRRRRSKNCAPAQILAFPPGRHKRIVAFIAAEMRKQQTSDEAEEYLISHLNIEWGRLANIGIAEDQIETFCRDFAFAAWAIVLRGHDHEVVA
jgi:hypothetical protein